MVGKFLSPIVFSKLFASVLFFINFIFITYSLPMVSNFVFFFSFILLLLFLLSVLSITFTLDLLFIFYINSFFNLLQNRPFMQKCPFVHTWLFKKKYLRAYFTRPLNFHAKVSLSAYLTFQEKVSPCIFYSSLKFPYLETDYFSILIITYKKILMSFKISNRFKFAQQLDRIQYHYFTVIWLLYGQTLVMLIDRGSNSTRVSIFRELVIRWTNQLGQINVNFNEKKTCFTPHKA